MLLCWAAIVTTAVATPAFKNSVKYESGALGPGPSQSFNASDLTPVQWNLAQTGPETYPGLIFIAPRGQDAAQAGASIFHQNGTLVYDAATYYGATMAFYKFIYRDADHLLIWTGTILDSLGFGHGHYLLLDTSYIVVANFTTNVDGTLADFHDAQIHTDGETAMLTVFPVRPADLSSHGSSTDGYVVSSGFQRVNIASNEPIFTWLSFDHVDPTESYVDPGSTGSSSDRPWDFFHINSVSVDDLGNYLVNSRHCHTAYYIDGTTGTIIWRLGGKRSDFAMGNKTQFHWQHDARWRGSNRISLFDNGAAPWATDTEYARGLLIQLNTDAMTAELITEYLPYSGNVSESQGNIQILNNDTGDALVGWGSSPYFSQHYGRGEIQRAVHFGVGRVQSYRAYLFEWSATPSTSPSINITANASSTTIYISWNGATEVIAWELFGTNSSDASAKSLALVSKYDFETTILYHGESYTYFQVAALNSKYEYIGYSAFREAVGASGASAATDGWSLIAFFWQCCYFVVSHFRMYSS